MSEKIEKSNVEDICELSMTQKGMLFHYEKDVNTNIFNVQLNLIIKGGTQTNILKQAFKKVQLDNSGLRSVFRWKNLKNPIQVILKETELNWEELDYSKEPSPLSLATSLAKKEWNERFDLELTPLKILIIKISDLEQYLSITHHHMLYDGWSTGVLLNELFLTYDNLCNGTAESSTPKLSFNILQKAILDRTSIDESKAYWTTEFQDYNSVDLSKKINKSEEILKVQSFGDISLINEFSKQNKVTSAAVVYTLYGYLYQRFSNSNDIIFGTTISGRKGDVHGIETAIGNFINTIPLRFNTSKGSTFLDTVNQVNDTLLERETFDQTSYGEIKEYLKLKPTEDLFDSNVVIENYPIDEKLGAQMGALNIQLESVSENTDIPLLVSVFFKDELELEFAYKPGRVNGKLVENMAAHFTLLYEKLLSNPTTNPVLIDLPELERNRLQFDLNSTSVKYSKNETVLDLFKIQVEQQPLSTAVKIKDASLTYLELDEKSNQLANFILSEGVQPEELIAICLDRSLEMVIGILGIMKAGCSYVPIDPEYPKERIDFILEDTASKVLVCQSSLESEYVLPSEVKSIALDKFDFNGYVSTSPEVEVTVDHLAYVIYTSGTTGRPKGVMNQHSGIYNRLLWMRDYLDLQNEDVILQKTTFCFDVSVWELILPLIAGVKMVLAEPDGHKDSLHLQQLIAKEKVSIMHFVPSMLSVFLLDANNDQCKSLKHVVCSGEELKPTTVQEFKEKLSGTRLHNLYGPTEAAIDVTAIDLTELSTEEALIPIGKPVANTQLYIVDRHTKLQPEGVAGELLIGGIQVARGYLNREELTTEKFIANPFNESEESKLYRTGDLARWMPDGNIEYLGRIDNQVKIRGYRIELGEIENGLSNYQDIDQAVVLVKEQGDNKLLVAYYVAEQELETEKLKAHLLSSLPDYMVPAHYVHLVSMPLTSNGKLDRKGLPEFQMSTQSEYVAPKSKEEHVLVAIWAKLLELESSVISTETSFFELGGNSLNATVLVNAIWKQMDATIGLNDVFNCQTIESLAMHISNLEKTSFQLIKKADKKDHYALSSAQRRLHFLYDFDSESLAYNMPYAAKLVGELDAAKLESAFFELINRHESLRTSFQSTKDETVQYIENVDSFKVTHIENGLNRNVNEIITDFIQPFDLKESPLFRVGLVNLSDQLHILLVDMHHIIADGVSHSILIKDFIAIYNGKTLPELELQYKDYAEWQQLTPLADAENKKTFWKNQFSDTIPVLNLPNDKPRAVQNTHSGSSVSIQLSEEDTQGLKQLSKIEEVTLFMVLLSAYNVLLSKLSGQEDIVVGTPVAGRYHPGLESIMGMFVNTIAIRNKPTPNATFNQFLSEVKSTTQDCLNYQDYPYEELIDDLKVMRDTSRNPLFDTMLVLQNFDDEKLSIPNLEILPLNNLNNTSKFDLTLTVVETSNGLELNFEYNTDLFFEETVTQFGKYFTRVVKEILKDSTAKLSEINILSEEEESKLLKMLNHEAVVYPKNKTILDLFAEQVSQTPTATAVQYEKEAISYEELDRRSTQVGVLLRTKGVKRDDVIGLLMDRTLDTVVGMFGILKAGGAYLPIDVDYPEERKKYIVEDSKAQLVLTSNGVDLSILDTRVSVVKIENALEITEGVNDFEYVNMPSDLCYIIYTSGTTGNPKGVMIEHGNIVRLFNNDSFQFKFGTEDVWTMFHSHCFDFSVWEMYGALLFGGRLIVIPKAVAKDTDAYLNLLKTEGVTVLNQTPSAFYNLIQQEEASSTRLNLRYVIFGGEALSPSKLSDWYAKYPDTELVNMFGITETTVHVTYKSIGKQEIESGESNIGLPIPTLSAYVLNQNQQLVPRGVLGELFIGGAGVSRGYLGKPELTAERFVANPFKENDCLYRTGDLARITTEGELEYIGRIDHQVQLRGFRIELGEIESQLSIHPEIDQVAVVVKGEEEDKKLVCYFVSKTEISDSAIRSYLSKKVMEYMIPSHFVKMETLPLTSNGKLDFKLLPEIKHSAVTENSKPKNETQKDLVKIWAGLLSIEETQVGVNTNFFEMGGNSIKVVKMVNEINDHFNIKITVANVFTYPMISSLAEFLHEDNSLAENEDDFEQMDEALSLFDQIED